MKPLAENFCTVIAGQWNPNIFRPDWVKQNLSSDKDDPVEVAFPIGDPSLPPRIRVEDTFIYPSQSRLDIRTDKPTKAGLQSTANLAIKCLELLTHTPVSAVGINLSFKSAAGEAAPITRLFSFDDDANIAQSFKLQGAEIKRSFKFQDCTLNLTCAYNTTDIKVDFNFHLDCKNADEAIEQIKKCSAENLYDHALAFLKDTYNLDLDTEEAE